MKVDLFAVMYNEEFMLPYFLRHYEKFVDRIFVWNDDSTDRTLEILQSHPKVTVLPMEVHGDNDPYWITSLYPQYEQLSRNIADYVICADTDEFIYHPDILSILEQEKEKGTQVIYCKGYTMISENLPVTTGQIYEEIKLGLPDKLESKWTIHSPDIHIRHRKGRHSAPHIQGEFIANPATGIKLLHYRFISETYFEYRNKINRDRLMLSFPGCNPVRKRTMPDRSRDDPLKWFREHKDQAVNVVDDL